MGTKKEVGKKYTLQRNIKVYWICLVIIWIRCIWCVRVNVRSRKAQSSRLTLLQLEIQSRYYQWNRVIPWQCSYFVHILHQTSRYYLLEMINANECQHCMKIWHNGDCFFPAMFMENAFAQKAHSKWNLGWKLHLLWVIADHIFSTVTSHHHRGLFPL